MKTKTIIFTLVIFSAVVLAACSPTSAPASVQDKRTVSVNGTGIVTLTPDMATIQVGVQTENADADMAVDENSRLVDSVMAAIKEFGIADEDIKTANFSVYPRQIYSPEGEITDTRYIVQNTVVVTVKDLDILGELLEAVVDAGANTIYGITFDVSDRESAIAQAMEAAMENAKARAETLATAAGATLGEVQTISSYVGGGGYYAVAKEAAYDGVGGAGVEVPISPGEMEIQVDISVVYELE